MILATLRDLDTAGQLIELGYHVCAAFSKHSEYVSTFLTLLNPHDVVHALSCNVSRIFASDLPLIVYIRLVVVNYKRLSVPP